MKKLILILITSVSFSQTYISVGADIKNAIVGSQPTNNKPSFNGIFRFGMIGSLGKTEGIEVTIGYETFKKISYDRYFFTVGKNINITDDFTIVPAYELSLINRWGVNWGVKSSHLAFLGANIGFRYKLSEKLKIELLTAILDRVDLNTMYGGRNIKISNALVLIYKL